MGGCSGAGTRAVAGVDVPAGVGEGPWAGAEAQTASPLARRPYDLRHGAASLWLNPGVQPTEVARRLGHSVAVLLRVYANCVDGEQDAVNERTALALSAGAGRGTLAPAPAEQHRPEPACGPDADQSEATSDG